MLIDSPRLTDPDRQHWQRLEHFDDVLSRSPQLAAMADRARRVIEEFAATGPSICAVSWGKDSVVVAHLLATSDVADQVPLVFARARHWETPEVDQVRDAFLARHPHMRYEEREYVFRVPMRGEPGEGSVSQDAYAEVLSERYISGIRAEESKTRRMSLRHRGEITKNTCRPIGQWRSIDVFAYLHSQDLPIHPAYAMTFGGAYDRGRIRVHALGCALKVPVSVPGWLDMHAWERAYYRDVMEAAVQARIADGTSAGFTGGDEW